MTLEGRRILIVSPHPDDEVIGCGGLLEKAKRLGCEVFVFFMCLGKSRQLVTGETEETERLAELSKVSREANFEYKILFVGREFLRLDTVAQKDLIDPIEDTIEEFTPDLICIPSPNSYDQDHRATHNACLTALRPIPRGIRHFVSTVLVYEEPYTWTTGTLIKPIVYLDTTDVEENKAALMRLYKSQNRESPFPRSTENLIRHMRIRGSEVGLDSAEAYHLLRGILE